MPANQNLRSALPMARGDLLQAGVLQDPRAAINKGGVGSHYYSSLSAELSQFWLAHVGVALNLSVFNIVFIISVL